MLEDKFLTKEHLDASLDSKIAELTTSIYRALILQTVAIVGLFAAIYKFCC